MPAYLESQTASNPTRARINILNPTAQDGAYVKVEYAHIRQYVRELHDKHDAEVDIYLHMGMAFGWNFVSVERRAYRQDMTCSWWSPMQEKGYYLIKDNVGKTVEDAGPCPWMEVPIGLNTMFDVDKIIEGAQSVLAMNRSLAVVEQIQAGAPHEVPIPARGGHIPVKAHHEGGAYCCGFINYESLANCYTRRREANVLFCHIPGQTDKASLEGARDAVLAVIVAAVSQLLNKKVFPEGPQTFAVMPRE